MSTIRPSVAAFRDQYRRTEIGRRYSGWLHFAFTSVVCVGIIAWAALFVRGATAWEWLIVPLTFLFANAAEYAGHKRGMHVPRRWTMRVYERHTHQHHRFFTHDAMGFESSRDFHMVLLPPVLVIYFFGAFAVPAGAALWAVASPNVARLYVAAAMGYFLVYEWLHFLAHLDPSSKVGRHPAVVAMRRHHQTHHDPALMNRYNYNFTFPLCDWVFGTAYPRSLDPARPISRLGLWAQRRYVRSTRSSADLRRGEAT